MLAFTLVAELLVAALLDAFLPDEQTDLRLGMMVGMLVLFLTLTIWVASASDKIDLDAPLLSTQEPSSLTAQAGSKNKDEVEEDENWDEKVMRIAVGMPLFL